MRQRTGSHRGPQRPVPSTRERSRSSCAPAGRVGREALRDHPSVPRPTRRGPRRSGRDWIDNPKTGEPIASGPFLVEGWPAGGSSSLVPNLGTGDASSPRRPPRLPLRARHRGPAAPPLGRTRSTSPGVSPPGFVAVIQQEGDLEIATSPGSNLDQIWIRMGPGGHPCAQATSWSVAPSPTRSTGLPSSDSSSRRSDPSQRVVQSAAVPRLRVAHDEPNWPRLSGAIRSRRVAGPLQAGCQRGSRRRSRCVTGRGSWSAFRDRGHYRRVPDSNARAAADNSCGRWASRPPTDKTRR